MGHFQDLSSAMQLIFEILLFLIWSAFFVATLLGVWSEPSKKETSNSHASVSAGSSSPMEIANQLW